MKKIFDTSSADEASALPIRAFRRPLCAPVANPVAVLQVRSWKTRNLPTSAPAVVARFEGAFPR